MRTAWGGRGLLAVILGLEVAAFATIGHNFFTTGNAFEVSRLSVEIGLLAVAMTPVIVSGGIDLSVGSLMGLSAVVFGLCWRDLGMPIPLAAVVTLAMGAAAGAMNGLLITRLRIPPLIVTLGSLSLFRGLAEGLTGGVDNVTAFPPSFLFLGQGYLLGVVPAQVPIFVAVAVAYGIYLSAEHGRARVIRRRILGRGGPIRRAPRRPTRRAGLPALGPRGEPGGDRLRLPSEPGEGGRRARLRTLRDHGRRPGRDVDLRRPGEHRRDSPRPRLGRGPSRMG